MRKDADFADDEKEDDELPQTPDDVIRILGYDPLDE